MSTMVVDDGERQPLLSHRKRREEPVKEESWLSSCVSNIRASWPVYQIVLLLLIYQISYYGQVAATCDIVRDLTCARYYERNLDQIDLNHDDPCSSDLIESQSARILLVFELFLGLGSAIATIQFGKKFSIWGRKPILVVSLLTIVLFPLACIVIPRGYPYGPLPSESIITPTTSIYILGVVSAMTGLLGASSLPLCCFRLLVVDHSDTADRTKNLSFVVISYLLGIMIGPLVSAAASYVVPIYASGIDKALINFAHRLFSSTPGILSSSAIHQNEHGNVTPFIICVCGGIFSIIYVIFFVKETAFSNQPAAEVGVESNEETPLSTELKPSKLPITPFRALFPVKQKNGTYDMRITALFLTMVLLYCAASVLDILILFFGHGMHWSPSSVGYLISSLGATRLVTMFLILPFLLVFLERKTRRPSIIAHFTVEELRTISKDSSSSEEAPVDASAFASEADLDERKLQQGAISLWRARVDRSIIIASWGVEVVGWLVIGIGASFHESYTLLVGNILTGLGVGGTPALQSFGLTVTSDVLAGAQNADHQDGGEEDEEADTSQHHGHAGEIFFSLLSFAESVVSTIMPIINNLIYSTTLSSFPAACFVLSSSIYLAALVTLSTIAIHRHQ